MGMADISITLNNQEHFGLTVHFRGGDEAWEHRVAEAYRIALQTALGSVRFSMPVAGGVKERRTVAPATEPQPPAPEPMTVEKMIEEWWQSLGPLQLQPKVKAKMFDLVQAQARRDAGIARDGAFSVSGPIIADGILAAARLK